MSVDAQRFQDFRVFKKFSVKRKIRKLKNANEKKNQEKNAIIEKSNVWNNHKKSVKNEKKTCQK